MLAEATRHFFDAIAPRYDRVYARDTDEMRACMRTLVEVLGPPRDVLDLGIGTGAELPYLLDAGHRVVGVDVSPEMLALCARRSRPVRCIEADLWAGLPVDDGSFDAVIALFGTLAHAPDEAAVERLGRELQRVLRPGGVFYAEVPTAAWAAAHASFVDPASSARIDVSGHPASVWEAALAALDVTCVPREDELVIRPRSRPSPAAR